MRGWDFGCNNLARFRQHTFKCVDNDDAAVFSVLVEMSVVLVVAFNGLQQQTLGQLSHLRRKAANGNNQATLLSSLGVGKDRSVEQFLSGWGAAKDNVRGANLFLLEAFEFVERWCENAKFGLVPTLTALDCLGNNSKLFKDLACAVREAVVDDVDGLDGAATHHQGQADVPVCLHTASKNSNSLDVIPTGYQTRRTERRTESRKRAGMDEAERGAIWRKQVDDARRADGLYGRVLSSLGRG